MDFELSDEQYAFKQLAKNFSEQKLAPYAQEWDANEFFSLPTLHEAAALGLAAIYTKHEFGGTGLSRLDAALIFEELAQGCLSTAAFLSIHNMVCGLIDTYANETQRAKWLPSLVSMNWLGSYCLTEPSAGSDAASLKTTALRQDNYYFLNGTKAFISGGSVSDIYVCMVRTGEAGPKGISCIFVEKNTPGLSFGKKEEKLGWCSQPTTMVYFENCKVPIENLIGKEGEGFKIALNALNGGRINIAACSLGGAQACLTKTLRYMKEREQFNKKLAEFQVLQFKVADMLTELEAARLLVYRAAQAYDAQHPDTALYCAMAKRYATDAGFHISDQALQLHGGYGYLKDYGIERHFRDLRANQILEGSNEIMRNIISKQIFASEK
ncbi:MAG: acyl-CoA dehydrogenase family protein [Gammaproteobacteria bacterium]|nr:acyl-CoA dehydrogenase family protein [Gammaproteobacteria bacterium]